VELERARWLLSLGCLKAVLDAATKQQACHKKVVEASCLRGNTVFLHTDIMEASSFDPFTHVYMFSVNISEADKTKDELDPITIFPEFGAVWSSSHQT